MKISVCMATYNGEAFIFEQIQSILTQIGDDSELIISDDGSKDNTLKIVKKINDRRIKVVAGPQKGLIKNFENALNLAHGDFVFLADQDDKWLDNKVSVMLQSLQTYDLVLSNAYISDENLEFSDETLFQQLRSKKGVFGNLFKNRYVGCCLAFNKRILRRALPFPNNLPMHDWWIGLIGELFGRVKYIEKPLLLYRRHGSNVSFTSVESKYSIAKKIRMRGNITYEIIKRFCRRTV